MVGVDRIRNTLTFSHRMIPRDSQSNSTNARRESWLSLDTFYESESGRNAHFQFRYIVKRLFNTDVAQRYTIREAFLLPYIGEERDLRHKSLDELHADYLAASTPSASKRRGLYFAAEPYGVRADEIPHVVVFTGPDGSTLYAQVCRGLQIVSSHVCQPRKEIPCILSLLRLLDDRSDAKPE